MYPHPQLVVWLKVEPELVHAKWLRMHLRVDRELHGFVVGRGDHAQGRCQSLPQRGCFLRHHLGRPPAQPDVLVDGAVGLTNEAVGVQKTKLN